MRPSIVLFGDSLTQQAFGVDGKVGWGSLLASNYARRADVYERGYYGYNTRHALEILPRVCSGPIESSDILFCTVLFGSNDAVDPGQPQHVPMEEYGVNLSNIVRSIRKRMIANFPIILITPPPVDESAWASFKGIPVSNRSNSMVRQYGDVVKRVGNELNCQVLDAWHLLDGESENRSRHLTDGVHLAETGNRLIYAALNTLIRQKFPDLAPMEDTDGDGKYGNRGGIPIEEKLWTEMS